MRRLLRFNEPIGAYMRSMALAEGAASLSVPADALNIRILLAAAPGLRKTDSSQAKYRRHHEKICRSFSDLRHCRRSGW